MAIASQAARSLKISHTIRSICVGSLLFVIAAIFPKISVCIVQRTLGIPCPVCGATRSILALYRFSLIDSFLWNPGLWLGVLSFCVVLIVFKTQSNKYQLALNSAWIIVVFIGIIRAIVFYYFPQHQLSFHFDF